MTITEGAVVSNTESSGSSNVVRIGGPTGATNGCWVMVAASFNRTGGVSALVNLALTGPGSEDAIVGGSVNTIAGANYAAAWIIFVADTADIPAVGETNPADMWTVTATQGGGPATGDMAIAAFVLNGVMPGSPIDSLTAFVQATTTTPTWDLTNTDVDDVTVYLISCNERDLAIDPNTPAVEIAEVKSANATVSRRTTLWIGKVHMPTAGDPGTVTTSLGATARPWRTFAFGLMPAGLIPVAGPDQTVPAGVRVFLDATDSILATTYLWEQQPETGDPEIILLNADEAIAEFVSENSTETPIEYTLKLTVGDGTDTAEDVMHVTVNPTAVIPESLDIMVCNGTEYV